jgi:mannosyltransferase OCH1-like enzyme
MQTWSAKNPSWNYCLWSSEKGRADGSPWWLSDCIDAMPELNGKADIMRYEILLEHGGLCVDADSECLRPLPDSFLCHDAWACYENERHCPPGWVATGYLAATKGSPLMRAVLEEIHRQSRGRLHDWATTAPAWKSVGPGIFTEVSKPFVKSGALHVYPAGLFIPEHYSGVAPAPCDEPPYARQYWGSTVASKHYKYAGLT